MSSKTPKSKLYAALVVIAILAGLNVWQYARSLEGNGAGDRSALADSEQGSANSKVLRESLPKPGDDFNRPAEQVSYAQAKANRGVIAADRSEPTGPTRELALKEELLRSRKENDELRVVVFQSEFLSSESASASSERVTRLLGEMKFSQETIESVNLETRLCLRGLTLTDEEIVWMGGCAESGAWPVTNEFGRAEIHLSLAQKFGPKRLSEKLNMVSLWNLMYEASSHAGVVKVWGADLATIYRRLPHMQRVWMEFAFSDALISAGVDL